MIYAIALMLFQFLALLYGWTGSWVLALLLLTLLIKLLLFPLTYQQMRTGHLARLLQPEIKALEPLKKKNLQEYNRRVWELYQKYNVNPFSGCLPLFIQIPILFALFAMIRNPVLNQGAFQRERFLGMPLDAVVFQRVTRLPLPEEFVDRAPPPGGAWYVVRAQNGGTTVDSAPVYGFPDPEAPPYQSPADDWDNPLFAVVSRGQFADRIEIQYPAFPFTNYYEILRYPDPESPPESLTGEGFRQLQYRDEGLPPKTVRYYEVRAHVRGGEVVSSGILEGYTGADRPWDVRASRGTFRDAVRIEWKRPTEASRFSILRATGREGPFQVIAELGPQVAPGTHIVARKGGRWDLIYLPGLLLVLLYIAVQLLYQREYTRQFGQMEGFNMNFFLIPLILLAFIFPVGLLIYFTFYMGLGIMETRIIGRLLQRETTSLHERKGDSEG